MSSPLRPKMLITSLAISGLLLACAPTSEMPTALPENPDKLLIIDCLLPPQVRKLGSSMTYAAARRPIKTSAADCEIRGGEYVAYDRADYRTALAVWLPEAQAGDATAQNHVGQIYEKGLGLSADYSTAAHWYQQAAAQGFAEAQINLGYLYEKGLGVEKNAVLALNWYRKASGIKDDSLQFASAVEVAQVSQAELATLQQKLNQERERSRQYETDLAAVRNDLAKIDQELQLAQSQKRNKELELQLARAQKGGSDAEVEHDLRKDIEQYQKKLAEAEKAKSDVQNKEVELAQRLETSTLQLASAELNQGLLSIELIDPPMSITRGVRGTVLDKDVKEKEVFGKINTASGIDSVMINGMRHELDEFNMFWVKVPVRDSVTPVDIVATDKFGQKVNFSFSIFSDQSPQAATAASSGDIQLGTYHALIIGNNTYQKIPVLQTAVNDAQATDQVLRERYGFKTRVLLNANRLDILSALDELRRTMTADDNLLIYYAGHGEIDRLNNRGYWLPVDADPEARANWISNTAVSDMINAMSARQVMVIADSCYSGTLAQSNLAGIGMEMNVKLDLEWVKSMEDIKARIVLTSGGIKPVLDIGGGQHSIFADALLSVLNSNEGLIEGHSVFREVMRRMRVGMARINQSQVPEYAPIKHAGHEGGEFFLRPVRS